MTYESDILLLSPTRLFTFNNTASDTSSTDTFTPTEFATTPITRDSTHSLRTNGTGDAFVGPAFDGLQNASRRQVSFWFRASAIQGPPTLIYKEGGATAGIAFILWAGNNVMAQVWDDGGTTELIQVYGDKPLSLNRNYHLSIEFSDSTQGGEVVFKIDGVAQSSRTVKSSLATAMTAYTGTPTFGNLASGEIPVGNGVVLLVAVVQGFYSHLTRYWGTIPSESNFYNTIFGRGAIPEFTITAGTEAAMQAQLDLISACGDFPLGILVEEVTGGGDLNLSSAVTFSEDCSVHFRYEGSGNLNVTNNGGNASTSTGNVNYFNPFTLTLTNIEPDTEVRVFEAGTETEVAGQETVNTGTFASVINVSAVDIRIVSLNFRITSFKNVAMTNDVTIQVQQFIDRNYNNP